MRNARLVIVVLITLLIALELQRGIKYSNFIDIFTGETKETSARMKSQEQSNQNPNNNFIMKPPVRSEQPMPVLHARRAQARLQRMSETEVEKLVHVFQEWCLPKLVCEIFANQRGGNYLSSYEQRLLEFSKKVTLSSLSEASARYRFATHMGQFLMGIEGSGCHNFFSQCPFTKSAILRMAKRMK